MNDTLLHIENLQVRYGGIEAVKGVSFDVHEGEIVTLIGANGAGKSSTLRSIAGLEKPSAGKIVFRGDDLTGRDATSIVKKGITLVPEGRRIFPALTVKENLILGTCSKRKYKDIMNTTLEEVFELFPILKTRYNQTGGTLSGGEQQMLAIGRALMAQPKVLCLDEPSLGLAPIIIDEVFDRIIRLNRETGLTVLLVEQNAFLALDVADRAYVLNTGKVTMEGTGKELADDPGVQEEYLGIKAQ